MTYEYEKVLTPSSGLRLHLNENTAGCSPKVLEALQRLTRQDVAFYPGYDEVVTACATRLGVDSDRLVLTNGLDEGILALTVAALRQRDAAVPEAVVVVPAFDMYASTASGVGARVVEVPLGPDFTFPTERILDAIGAQTRLLFLTSPNNPTGLLIPRADIVRIARHAPHVQVLVDEAYADFARMTLVGDREIATLPNVFIGRTFAKAYGLAGLRAGVVIGDPQALQPLRHVVPPFSINVCAAAALAAGLGDEDYYQWYLRRCGRRRRCSTRHSARQGLNSGRARRTSSWRTSASAHPQWWRAWRRAASTCATSLAIGRVPAASGSPPA